MLGGNYPLIYAKEAMSVINNQSGIGTLGRSEQTSLIERDDVTTAKKLDGTPEGLQATNGYVRASSGIKPYDTMFYFELNRVNENKDGQVDVLCPNNQNYWVASRNIRTYGNSCDFSVWYVQSNWLQSSGVFPSDATYGRWDSCSFPCCNYVR